MKNRKVVSSTNLPARLPITFSIVMWLLLDRIQAPGYVYGIVFTIIGIMAIAAAIDIWKREDVTLWKND